jgi:hypothetical protein
LSVTISGSTISNNIAFGGYGDVGGAFGDGGNAGNAEGGGLFVDASSVVALSGSLVTGNQAFGGFGGFGGTGGNGGNNGSGLGGGVYLAGTGSTRTKTTIAGNSASTAGNDVYGTFS